MQDTVGRFSNMERKTQILVMTALAVVVLLIILVLFWAFSNRKPVPKRYFYDLSTKRTVILPAADVPPVKGKDGKRDVVRAMYFTTNGSATKHLVYFWAYTPAARQAILAGKLMRGTNQGKLVRLAKPESPWVPFNSPQGAAVIMHVLPKNANIVQMMASRKIVKEAIPPQ